MGLLVFVAVAAMVVGGPLVWMALRSFRTRPGTTNMVLIGATAGEAERNLWLAALRSAGIHPHVSNVGHITPFEGSGPTPYSYEFWVRAQDEEEAREVLGL
jgi:hypothetical protein